MKINGRKNAGQIGPLGPISVPNAAEEAGSADAPAAGDQVNLSNTQELKQLNAAVKAMPSVRTEKVSDIKEQVDDGSYYVESEKLARRVVDEVLSEELLKKS